jgi:hypothetical protein
LARRIFKKLCSIVGAQSVGKVKEVWGKVKISLAAWIGKSESFSPPFIANEDFTAGYRLTFYGDVLYRVDPAGALPAAFIAKRDIRAGEKVFNDPTDPKRSDLMVMGL